MRAESKGIFSLSKQGKELLNLFRCEGRFVRRELSQVVSRRLDQRRPFMSSRHGDHKEIPQIFNDIGAIGSEVMPSVYQL